MSLPHKGRLAIVTGASRGIGAAVANSLASAGANLILNHSTASSASACEEVATSLRQKYPDISVKVVQADLSSLSGPSELVAAADGKQIDIIINNAGTAGNQPLESVTPEEFERQYNINVRGPLLLIKAALKFLPNDRSGRIVNLSSVSATLGFKGQSVYGGTKAALDAMTRTWARELEQRATVNSVNPGPVETRMYAGTSDSFKDHIRPFIQHTPGMQLSEEEKKGTYKDQLEAINSEGGRRAKPEEIAGIISMLCSKEAGFCTGQVVCANGGMIFGLS